MNKTIEYYPKSEDKGLYYIEFSNWDDTDKWQWRLFQRQFMYSEEEWNRQLENNEVAEFMSNEVHPWQLECGDVNEIEHAVDLNTRSFLKFMVDALNEKVER